MRYARQLKPSSIANAFLLSCCRCKFYCAILRRYADGLAACDIAIQQTYRQRVLDQVLYGSSERASAVDRIIALLHKQFARTIVKLDRNAAFSKILSQFFELHVDDLCDIVFAKLLENYNVVDAI